MRPKRPGYLIHLNRINKPFQTLKIVKSKWLVALNLQMYPDIGLVSYQQVFSPLCFDSKITIILS